MTSEEFETNFTQILDTILNALANSSEVKPEKFYSEACRIENLQCLSPVFYDTLKPKEDRSLQEAEVTVAIPIPAHRYKSDDRKV